MTALVEAAIRADAREGWMPETDCVDPPVSESDARVAVLREAAAALLLAVDNAAFYALDYAEGGDEEPEWQTRLWDAADQARAVITPAADPAPAEGGEGRL